MESGPRSASDCDATSLPPDARIIYKTIDGGSSWQPTGAFPNLDVLKLSIDPSDTGQVYAPATSRLMRTMNGGGTWTEIPIDVPSNFTPAAFRVLVDPVIPTTLTLLSAVEGAGFRRSIDGGLTWETALMTLSKNEPPIRTGILHPQRPSLLIAAAEALGIVEYEVAPDLGLSVTGLGATLPISGNVTATLRVSNKGPHAASATDVTVNLPAWLTVAAPPAGCTFAAATLRCRHSSLRVGQNRDIPFTMAVGAAPSHAVIVASAGGHERDPISSDNSQSIAVASGQVADMGVTWGSNTNAVDRGGSVTLTATVINNGPSSSSASQLVLELPGLTVQSMTPGGACAQQANTLTCNLGPIAFAQRSEIQVQAVAASPGFLETTARITGADTDENAANDFKTNIITSRPLADASVEVSAGAGTATVGQNFQFTAIVRNAGPDAAPATLSVNLTGGTITSIASNTGACNVTGGVAQCALNPIAANGSASANINVTPGTAGTMTASATVVLGGTDGAAGNNSANTSVTVAAAASSPPPANNGGGGGRFEWLGLALLALALGVRYFRLRRCG
jgi:hypothetical protein